MRTAGLLLLLSCYRYRLPGTGTGTSINIHLPVLSQQNFVSNIFLLRCLLRRVPILGFFSILTKSIRYINICSLYKQVYGTVLLTCKLSVRIQIHGSTLKNKGFCSRYLPPNGIGTYRYCFLDKKIK
jgi:hypothetical protein